MMKVFKDADDAGYRAWIAKHQGGYVNNVHKSLYPGGQSFGPARIPWDQFGTTRIARP
jgi:hypothetical protein